MEFSILDIKEIIRLISNQIYFLKTKNIIKYGTSAYDTTLIEDTDLFKYIKMFYLNEYETILNTTNSLKEHKECLDEMNFVIDEIKTIIKLYTEKKLKEKEELEKMNRLSVRDFLNKTNY